MATAPTHSHPYSREGYAETPINDKMYSSSTCQTSNSLFDNDKAGVKEHVTREYKKLGDGDGDSTTRGFWDISSKGLKTNRKLFTKEIAEKNASDSKELEAGFERMVAANHASNSYDMMAPPKFLGAKTQGQINEELGNAHQFQLDREAEQKACHQVKACTSNMVIEPVTGLADSFTKKAVPKSESPDFWDKIPRITPEADEEEGRASQNPEVETKKETEDKEKNAGEY